MIRIDYNLIIFWTYIKFAWNLIIFLPESVFSYENLLLSQENLFWICDRLASLPSHFESTLASAGNGIQFMDFSVAVSAYL